MLIRPNATPMSFALNFLFADACGSVSPHGKYPEKGSVNLIINID
jgi:hypothetical protein